MDPPAVCPSCGAAVPREGALCGRCGPTSVSRRPRPPGLALEEAAVGEGEVLEGKWRLGKQLGVGGMGTVWAAHELALDRQVAIKVLNADLCRDEQFVARFEREARSTARLEHPNVVQIYAVGRHAGRPFMVMKKLEGETLAFHLEAEGKLSPARALEIMRQLCAGLGHLHSHGCVHRDIKAGNVFISPDGVATILDLGVVRDARDRGNTQVGTIVGTPRYMSPEQAQGALQVDHRADLYALGVLLFECLAGRAPFESENNNAIIQMHATAEPPDVTTINRDLPAAMGPILRRALAKKPDDRFPSAGAFLAEVEAALAPAVPDPQDFDPSGMHSAYEPNSNPGAVSESWRRRWLRRALLFALFLSAAGLVTQLYGTRLLARFMPARTVAARDPVKAEPDEPKPTRPLVVTEPARPEKTGPVEPRRPTEPKRVEPKRAFEGKRPKGLAGILKVVTLLGGRSYPANVTIDGVERGRTPVTLELAAAQHVVRLERAGFQSIEQSVIVPSGGTKEMRIELVP